METQPARIIVRFGDVPDQEFILEKEVTTFGRGRNNDIVTTESDISRQHSRIISRESGYLLEDLGSTNGTFINGKQINRPVALNHGDVLEFGETISFVFLNVDQDLNSTVAFDKDDLPEEIAKERERLREESEANEARELDEFEEVPESVAIEEPQPEKRNRPPTIIAPRRRRVEQQQEKGQSRTLLSVGCLLFILAFACTTTLLVLDYTAPELLYCGPLRSTMESVVNLFGFGLDCAP